MVHTRLSLGFILQGEEDENSEAWEGSSHISQLTFGGQWSRGSLEVPDSELDPWRDRRCQITGCGFSNFRGTGHTFPPARFLAHSPSASWRLALSLQHLPRPQQLKSCYKHTASLHCPQGKSPGMLGTWLVPLQTPILLSVFTHSIVFAEHSL